MTKSAKKIVFAVIAVILALAAATAGSLAWFTDSASIHAGIKTSKITGTVSETTMAGTPDTNETWLESTTTVKDGDKVLFSALTTDYKDNLATKDTIKTYNVGRGNALSITGDSAVKTNQTFSVKFTNTNTADEVFYPEIHLTAVDGKSIAQYEKILGVADASAKATIDKTIKYQNVVNGTSEDLLTANIYTIPSLVNKTKVNSDGSLSLYLDGVTVKAGATVECSYALTENLNGHLDYTVPQVYVTTNATIRYASAVNSLWYGTAEAPSTKSSVIYALAPDCQTRVLWKDVSGKYTVRGGQSAINVTDKDAVETIEALNYTVAAYQYTGGDQAPTAYLLGAKTDYKLYKAIDGKWSEVHAAVERGSYKAVVDTSAVEGFAVSHNEFYFDIVKATSNVDYGNKPLPDGTPDPDNKLVWNINNAEKVYDGKQISVQGTDKYGNVLTDFVYTNTATGEETTVAPKDVGIYTVRVNNDDNHEYTGTATITITKATLQVTPTVSKSSLVPTDKPSLGYTVSGFVDGDNELDISGKNVQYIVDGKDVPSSGQTYSVGSHDLTCSGLTAKNYDFVYGITSFAIGKGTTTVDYENKPLPDGNPDPENKLTWVSVDSATKVYDGKPLSVIAKDSFGNVVDVEYYSADGKTKLDAVPKDVGNYVVKALESDSYTYSNTAVITITKATVTVTAVVDKTEMSYTDTIPANITYDIQGIVSGDEKYFDESEIGYIPSVIPSNTQFVPSQYNWSQNATFKPTDYGYAGKYTIGTIPEYASDKLFCKSDNYTLVYKDATIQVNPIEVTFGTDDSSVTIKGDSATKVYDGKTLDFKFVNVNDTSKSYWNVIYLDGSGNELDSAPKDVGTYTVRPGKNLAKYALVSTYPTIIITPAPLTATAKTDAATYTPTKKPVLSYELTGFVNNETEAVVDTTGLKYKVDGNEVESSGKVYATGTHTVSISGLTASNYAISYVDATFTVAKQKVSVTYDEVGTNKVLSWSGDVATKVYDGKATRIKGTDSAGNTITNFYYINSAGTMTSTPPTKVGTYTVKPRSSMDYDYINNGTLIITPAPLTVTVGDVQVLDNEKPEFAITYSGFVNSETADKVVTGTPSYTVYKDGVEVTADENGCYPAGEYSVTASGLTAANYTITYAAGTMTVEKSVAKPIIRSHSWSDTADFMQYKNEITGITFMNEGEVPESPTYGPWDVSAAKDGSVTAWMEGTEVYIVGNGTGTVIMPENSSSWFGSMSKLTTINGMDILDTSNVTNMDNLFDSCSSLTSIDLSGLDLGKVTQMRNMFAICTSLQSVDMHDLNTANLQLFSNVFARCESLTSVDMSGMDTHNVTDINSLFSRCLAFKQFNVGTLNLTNFDTAKVTNMSSLFYGCSNLESVNLTGFDTSSLENMSGMFNECSKLTSVVWGDNFDTSKTTNMGQLFANCSSLETVDVSKLNTSNATNISQMFMNNIRLKAVDLSGFDTANVQYMGAMFKDCNSLTELNLGNFNTSKVTDMYAMFANCNNLTSLNIISFDTGNVVYMNQMFFNCTSLPELNVTDFNTSKVTNMQEMFSNCLDLTTLDLSSFDTAKVTNMVQMFYKNYNLKTIYVSENFVTTKAWNSSKMFDGCTALVGGNGTVYDSKNVGSGYAHIDTADNPGYFTSIVAKNSVDDEAEPVVVNTDEVIDATPTPEPEADSPVEQEEPETTDSPAESSAESDAESESEEPTSEETVTE